MRIYRNSDYNEEFSTNVERLFRLIHNVLAKGQTTLAEKYILYLFTAITKFYIKESKPKNNDSDYLDLIDELGSNKSSAPVKHDDVSLLGDYHKLKSYRNGFQDDITKLVCSQVKSSNFYVFYFIFNLLKSSTSELLKNSSTQNGAAQVISPFKYICQHILFSQNNIPQGERSAFLHQTYDWFLDLLSSVNDERALSIVEGEVRLVLRSYVDNNELELFEAFLNSLSSRFFPFSLNDEAALTEYMSWQSGNYEYRLLIEKYRRLLENPRSLKQYSAIVKDFKFELSGRDWDINKEDYEQKVSAHLFNTFKLTYCRVLLVDVVCYALFKGKYDFFVRYLEYHSPADADASWLNENYSLQRFNDIIPFLQDYDKLMPESFMWSERHGIETYINTFLGYYILTDEIKTVQDYLNSISDKDVINTVRYNLQKIADRNILRKLPTILLQDKNTIDAHFGVLLSIAATRYEQLDKEEIESAPIDDETRENFFSYFFKSFDSLAVARSIYNSHNAILNENEIGQDVSIRQLFPRKAFIKQSGTTFLSPHHQLASIFADDETTFIFRQIAARATKHTLSLAEFEEFIRSSKDKFDLIISANTYNIKSNFPTLDFKESWADDNPQKKRPGYIGKLNEHFEVFWLGDRLPNKIFMMLNSQNIGQLINCDPPALSGEYYKRHEQLVYSFIDLANDEEHRKKLVEKGQDEEKLKGEVWIRIFESIKLNLPADFKAEYIEVTNQ